MTVENQDYVWRIEKLKAVLSDVRFVSFEPLIGQVIIDQQRMRGIHWIIAGGENGPGARPMDKNWVRALRTVSQSNHIPFFYKGAGKGDKKAILDGRTWTEMPGDKT